MAPSVNFIFSSRLADRQNGTKYVKLCLFTSEFSQFQPMGSNHSKSTHSNQIREQIQQVRGQESQEHRLRSCHKGSRVLHITSVQFFHTHLFNGVEVQREHNAIHREKKTWNRPRHKRSPMFLWFHLTAAAVNVFLL